MRDACALPSSQRRRILLTLRELRSGVRRRDATLIPKPVRTHEATVNYKERLGAFNDMTGRLSSYDSGA